MRWIFGFLARRMPGAGMTCFLKIVTPVKTGVQDNLETLTTGI